MHDNDMAAMTSARSMAALPFGGRYRLIDFALTAMYNASITQLGVIVKENYHSLMDHIGTGRDWDLARKNGGVSIFPPFSEAGGSSELYRSRIEAMRGIINYIEETRCKYFVLLDCDHVCNVDFESVVNNHIERGCDVSILCSDLPPEMQDNDGCVTVFCGGDDRVSDIRRNCPREQDSWYSMNAFVLSKELLLQLLAETGPEKNLNFESDVLRPRLESLDVRRCLYSGFVRRIYSIKSYFDASMSLLDTANMHELFYAHGPVYTKVFDAAPVRYGLQSHLTNSLVADGCIIEGRVENSLLFRNVRVEPGAVVRNSILMQNTVVQSGAELDFVVTDKWVTISEGHALFGNAEAPRYIEKSSEV